MLGSFTRAVNHYNSTVLRPFSGCQEFLTAACISTYFVPIMSITKNYLLNLSDAELKKESKSELKNDQISSILTTMKRIARQCSEKDGKFDVNDLRLEMILRLLRVSSFNGKMNALIEINKILQSSSNFDTLSCADAIPPDKLAVRNLYLHVYLPAFYLLVRMCMR